MRNNNRFVVRNLSWRSFRANKSRNIFALIAVVLTTLLITAVFTIFISLDNGMKQMMIHSYGRSTEVDFQYLTEEEALSIIEHPLIKEYGLTKMVTVINEGIFYQAHGEIWTGDENFANFTFTQPTTGRLPQTEKEIALPVWILEAMNLPKELGRIIHLDFEVFGIPHSFEFEVCGFYDSDIKLHPYGIMYISDVLADKLLTGVNPAQTRLGEGYYGVTKLTANLNGRISQIGENVDKILSDMGIDSNTVGVLLNGAYTSTTLNAEMIAALVLVISIILVSGYLLIYNIFYISVMRDVRFYGLLKTIGTTSKQLGRIVNFQSLLLCTIGIPIGLLLGYLMGVRLIPLLLNFVNIEYVTASPNPWIFMLGSALSLVTVLISCYSPAKKAGNGNAIEAVRFTSVDIVSERKIKQGSNGAKIYRMAWVNIFRSRKKAMLVIASLSLGLILFNIVYTYVNSFDVNKLLRSYINGDFLIADANYFSFSRNYVPSYTLGEDLLFEIKELDGVQEVAKVYYTNGFAPIEGKLLENIDNSRRRGISKENSSLSDEDIEKIMREKDSVNMYGGVINTQVYGFDDYWLDKLEENIIEGRFDREKFLSGNYLLLGFDLEEIVEVGDTITISLNGKDGEQRSYKVMGQVNDNALNSLSAHYIMTPGFSVYLPSSEFENLTDPNIMSATVIADESYIENLQDEIEKILSNNSDLDFRSRDDYIDEMKSDNQQFAFIGFTMCIVILSIGILNFINTTMTNIISRKQEFAMLQSVGMTTRQGKNILVLESIYYIALVLFVFVTIGYGISHFTISTLTKNSLAYTYKFTLLPIFICFPILICLSCILPMEMYKIISKDSVVNRLRETQ